MRIAWNRNVVVALCSLLVAAGYLWEAFRMPLGTMVSPGPGLAPILVGLLIAVLSLALLAQAWLQREKWEDAVILPAGAPGRRVVVVWIGLLAYAMLVNVLGHLLMAAILSAACLRVLGMRRWRDAILLSMFLSVASFYLFAVLLDVPLPEGLWAR
jgi:hypothetical protein